MKRFSALSWQPQGPRVRDDMAVNYLWGAPEVFSHDGLKLASRLPGSQRPPVPPTAESVA
jgi:hypothetical protein